MNTVNVSTGSLGPEPTVSVRVGTEVLDVALRGATPLRWLVDLPGGTADVLDGYRSAAELGAQDGVRNGVMAPFCNRVADARYRFDGVEQDLLPGSTDRTSYHGLVRVLPFALDEVIEQDGGVRVTLRCDALASGRFPGYPYRVEVEVSYLIRPGTLEVEIAGRNVGTGPAPFAAGWHAYFRLPGASTVNGLHLSVPARVAVQTDRALIPCPGPAAFQPIGAGSAQWRPIGDAVLDEAYAGLGEGPAAARTVLCDPATGVQLSLWQDRGLVHVFTGDTLARDRRASIAIEAVETMTNAFNRSDCAAAIRLEPGQRRPFRCGVELSVEKNPLHVWHG